MHFTKIESTRKGYLASVGKGVDVKIGPTMTDVAPK